jgi:hypothetical protein
MNSTCAWIEEMYGTPLSVLRANNPQIDEECSNIYINEVLCIDTEEFEYPSYNRTQYETLAYTYLPYCDE